MALLAQIDQAKIVVRIRPVVAEEDKLDHLRATIRVCDQFLSENKIEQASTLYRQAIQIRNETLKQLARLQEGAFCLGFFLLTSGAESGALAQLVGKSISGLYSRQNDEHLWCGGFSRRKLSLKEVFHAGYYPDMEPYTVSEAACAFRLPSPPLDEIPGLPIKRSRTSLALFPNEIHRVAGTIHLAVNEHQGMRQLIEMNPDDRMRHTFIVGQTGTGKSTIMETLVMQDIEAGHGLAVIDPHGEMVDSILGRIPKNREQDVILWDLLEEEWPIGFNLLEWQTIQERDLIIDELYISMHREYDFHQTGGPIFESNFRGMLKLLMGDKPRANFVPTILEFPLCYLEKRFRRFLQKDIADPQIHDFIKELERTGGEASLANLSPYITSKFSRFTQDTSLKRIFGQSKTQINFEEIMDKGKILLLKLGKGRFGEVSSALLANQIVSRFKLAAMKRGEMRPSARRDFFLYVDECHNLPGENFMSLLSEARKYRMGLILATQYTAQLSQSCMGSKNSLLSAILGNVGTLVTFRLGQEDAAKMEAAITPYFNLRDIIGLPNWCGYMRLQCQDQVVPPFSFKTIKNETPYSEQEAARLEKMLNARYGMKAKQVEAEMMARREQWDTDD